MKTKVEDSSISVKTKPFRQSLGILYTDNR
jgi:hypothetical protein